MALVGKKSQICDRHHKFVTDHKFVTCHKFVIFCNLRDIRSSKLRVGCFSVGWCWCRFVGLGFSTSLWRSESFGLCFLVQNPVPIISCHKSHKNHKWRESVCNCTFGKLLKIYKKMYTRSFRFVSRSTRNSLGFFLSLFWSSGESARRANFAFSTFCRRKTSSSLVGSKLSDCRALPDSVALIVTI